jgi:hypothetical protein
MNWIFDIEWCFEDSPFWELFPSLTTSTPIPVGLMLSGNEDEVRNSTPA